MNKFFIWGGVVVLAAVTLYVGAVWAFSDKVRSNPEPVVPAPAATTSTSDTSTTPKPKPTGTGMLMGTMSIGPICPVEQVDNPCKPSAETYAAHKVAVYSSDKQKLITTLTPDASGAFSASLPAGTYYVAMAAAQPRVGSTKGVPTTITITSGVMTHLAISIDTGIR
jgi:hypothetical protein